MSVLSAFLCVAALSSCVALHVGTLRLPADSPTFNPNHPATRQALMRELNIHAMKVEVLAANGGLNGGVWILSDPRRGWADMVLKLRLVEPELPSHPGEARHLASLASTHPRLAQDPDVIFPSRILSCVDAFGSKRGDLILMHKAPGQTFARLIFDKYYAGLSESEEFMSIFESVGRQLRTFHLRYGKQHADFHSANIMVNPADGNRITFIDLGGMGLPISDNDVQHLVKDLRLQSSSYHPGTFLERGILRFQRGYNNGAAGYANAHRPSSGAASAPRRPMASAMRPAAPAMRPAAPGWSAIGKTPGHRTSVTANPSSGAGEMLASYALRNMIADLEDALQWEHLIMGAMIVMCSPVVLRALHRKREP